MKLAKLNRAKLDSLLAPAAADKRLAQLLLVSVARYAEHLGELDSGDAKRDRERQRECEALYEALERVEYASRK